MSEVYNRNQAIRDRRQRRAQRCRYHVEAWYAGWDRCGVHHLRWVAIAHAWWISAVEGGRDTRVIDTRREEGPDAG